MHSKHTTLQFLRSVTGPPRLIHCSESSRIHWDKTGLRSECGFYFSITQPMNVPVHKTEALFKVWDVEFVNHICLKLMFVQQSVAFCADHARSSLTGEGGTTTFLEISIMYEACQESKDTKVLNMYNVFNLQTRHCEWIACI